MKIEKVAVIGSGVMGSGIAAQLTNAGLPVVLLDIKLEDRDLAKEAVGKMLKADPAPFMRKSNAKMITTGNLEDDLGMLSECDWIIEVVLEDLKIKHATYEKIESVRKKGAIVSSNTSTIPLHKLVEGQSDDFAKHFMITHFFNPPRYMRLLELVVGEKTDPKAAEIIHGMCDKMLGKGVVKCHDTPGFIANRLGVYWLTAGVNEAVAQGVPIEVADSVMSKPVGIPKTGTSMKGSIAKRTRHLIQLFLRGARVLRLLSRQTAQAGNMRGQCFAVHFHTRRSLLAKSPIQCLKSIKA